ncbi:MAG: 4'-phosphopantetheinyl transferase superfamily protein [Anaerolineae bacterium]|nr:4'-phosphopantetheinyl transferase superfamily protein [Anaerolineae bacterium]
MWRIPLDVPQDVVAGLAMLLSEEEQARAEQMQCADAQRQFVVSHGALRDILGRYPGLDSPEQIRFAAGARGKPFLLSRVGAPAIGFNLSHSEAFALCAVTAGRDVGVDVERIRPVPAWREIAARYFADRERALLLALSGAPALEAFLRGWTRKEAYTKALGEGVSQRWTGFSISLTPAAAEDVLRSEPEEEGWFTICPLEPGPGYVAALAARGTSWRLSCWQWRWTGNRTTAYEPV